MPLTPDDVRTRQFSASKLGRKGYEEQEVRAFLIEVAAELDSVTSARTETVSRLEATQQALIAAQRRTGDDDDAPAPTAETTPTADDAQAEPRSPAPTGTEAGDGVAARAARVLALAERTADEHVRQAEAEAAELLGDARERAATTDRDTDERRREVIGAIESRRDELEQRIESLRAFEREYRSRLGAYLQQQLDELHAAGAVPPDSGATDGATTDGAASVDLREKSGDPAPS